MKELGYQAFAGCCVRYCGDIWSALRKPFLLCKLHSLPRWIAEDAGEAALVEDLGEGEVPVEEAVLAGEGFDFGLEVGGEGLALDLSIEDWDRTFDVNVRGVFFAAQQAAKRMIASGVAERGEARIINIASIASHTVLPGLSAYCASKAASNQYLAALRLEVKNLGVGVSWVCPGVVETPFLERSGLEPKRHLPRLNNLTVPILHTDAVVRATIGAIERDRRQVTLPAIMKLYALSMRLLPGFSDWLQRRTG